MIPSDEKLMVKVVHLNPRSIVIELQFESIQLTMP